MKNNSNIYDSIIISSCLFGSVYIFSSSIKLLNKYMMDSIIYPVSIISGSIFIYGVIKFNKIIK